MPEEITADYEDLNPTDRVFRSARGHIVKVRMLRAEPAPDIIKLTFSGSLCDVRSGKALDHGPSGGHFVCAAHEVTFQTESACNIEGAVDDAIEMTVQRVEQAAENRFIMDGLAARTRK